MSFQGKNKENFNKQIEVLKGSKVSFQNENNKAKLTGHAQY